MARQVELAIAELRTLLIDRRPFDFLRYVKYVKPLFDEREQFAPDVAIRLLKLQAEVQAVCLGFAANAQVAWPQKEEFILAELTWLEKIANDGADKK